MEDPKTMLSDPVSIRIASFDIGKKNLAFYAEEFNVKEIRKLESKYNSLLKKNRRRKGGVLIQPVADILKKMYVCASHIPNGYGVFDIREYEDNILDIHVRANLHKLLESYMWLWTTCDIVCIEQQFFNPRTRGKSSKACGANMDAIKLGECLFSWFVDNFYPNKIIEYFGSQYKTQLLGAPHRVEDKSPRGCGWKPMSKQGRKDWSVEKAEEIFLLRNEKEMAEIFGSAKKGKRKRGQQKMDDVADCVIQCQAYKFKRIIARQDYT